MGHLALSQETILHRIISELKNTSGDEFFNTITLQLDKVIQADYTFIARIDQKKSLFPNHQFGCQRKNCRKL